MKITVNYFGLIAEITACKNESFSFSKKNISDFLELLFKKYPGLENTDFQVAQNHELVALDTLVTGNELALLPPFAGG